MEKKESSYLPGEKILYQEDNMVLAVEILENNCDIEHIAYKLRVIETITPHFMFGKARKGGELNFSRALSAGGCCFGLSRIIGEYKE